MEDTFKIDVDPDQGKNGLDKNLRSHNKNKPIRQQYRTNQTRPQRNNSTELVEEEKEGRGEDGDDLAAGDQGAGNPRRHLLQFSRSVVETPAAGTDFDDSGDNRSQLSYHRVDDLTQD